MFPNHKDIDEQVTHAQKGVHDETERQQGMTGRGKLNLQLLSFDPGKDEYCNAAHNANCIKHNEDNPQCK